VRALASVEDIIELYAERGGLHYGEGVTQNEHAVQCAMLAERAGAPPALVVAALLHDVGHLAAHAQERHAFVLDDRHEAAGATLLAAIYDEAVCAPVALHVAAKRHLCFTDPGYAAALSDASRRSLALQGGAFDAAEAAAFERVPYWREAVLLRRCDDGGKSDEGADRRFADFVPLLNRIAADHPSR
jgi:phosphonate degradation associated HDIG domain protein